MVLSGELLWSDGEHDKTSECREPWACRRTSLPEQWAFWPEAVLCGVPSQWIGQWMVVLKDALWAGRTNPHPEYLFQWEQSAAPSMLEVVHCNQPATTRLAVLLRHGVTRRLSVGPCCGQSGHLVGLKPDQFCSVQVCYSACTYLPSFCLHGHSVHESIERGQE